MACYSPTPKKPKLDLENPFYPVLPSELTENVPVIEFYTDTISEKKFISKVVLDLNSMFPIQEFGHLKRIKGQEVLLFPTANTKIEDVHKILLQKNFDLNLLKNTPCKVEVAKIAPKTRKQYEEVRNRWPCNFHPNKYTEDLIANNLFGDAEIKNHIDCMRLAIRSARFATKRKIAAVVFDPKIESVVAVGFDQTEDNPCKHSIMVVLDNVACTQEGGHWSKTGISDKIREKLYEEFPHLKFGARRFEIKENPSSSSDGPYLCTDYYVYVTHECCVMCAMALVHSRAKRVFFGVRTSRGGLQSLCKIQEVKDLNHHYEVFGGLLADQIGQLLH